MVECVPWFKGFEIPLVFDLIPILESIRGAERTTEVLLNSAPGIVIIDYVKEGPLNEYKRETTRRP